MDLKIKIELLLLVIFPQSPLPQRLQYKALLNFMYQDKHYASEPQGKH